MKTIIKIPNEDKLYLQILEEKIKSWDLWEKQKSYLERIIRVYKMPNLSLQEKHPVKMIIDKIILSNFFKDFSIIDIPEIVSEYETFDLFNFPINHVARRPSDSYFIKKSSISKESILLRPHTSVMRYHYLINWWAKELLEIEWDIKALSFWKVYRVDEFDKTHHECFHQIDWLRIIEKNRQKINQETLKEILLNIIKSIFWEDIIYRFNKDYFPYTLELK